MGYLTNSVALRFNAEASYRRNVGYEGNCTCKGGPTSCTIPKDFFPKAPCVAKWAAELDNGATVAGALVNMGENSTTVEVHLSDFLGANGNLASASYQVRDVWLGGRPLGTYGPD